MFFKKEPFISSKEIPKALKRAFELFNKATGASYSDANVKIGYFTFDNFPAVYKEFCENDFPSWLEEDYTNSSFYSDTQASAFVNGKKAGILINTTVPFTFKEWVHDLMHELAHIYAVQNELSGRSFYDEFCRGNDLSIGEDTIYIGYAIWREFIADYIVAFCTPHEPRPFLQMMMRDIREFDTSIIGVGKESLRAISLIMIALFTCQEYMDIDNKEDYFRMLEAVKPVDLEEYGGLISCVYDKFIDEETEPHIINVDFIETLGSLARSLIADKRKKLGDGRYGF